MTEQEAERAECECGHQRQTHRLAESECLLGGCSCQGFKAQDPEDFPKGVYSQDVLDSLRREGIAP